MCTGEEAWLACCMYFPCAEYAPLLKTLHQSRGIGVILSILMAGPMITSALAATADRLMKMASLPSVCCAFAMAPSAHKPKVFSGVSKKPTGCNIHVTYPSALFQSYDLLDVRPLQPTVWHTFLSRRGRMRTALTSRSVGRR